MSPTEVAALALRLGKGKPLEQGSPTRLATPAATESPRHSTANKSIEHINPTSGPGPVPKSSASQLKSKSNYTEEDFQKLLDPQTQPDKYKVVQFENAAEMMYVIDPELREGRKDLFAWQLETQEFLTHRKFHQLCPLRFLLRAANGSGKDAYVIAPFAVWFALTKIRARVIITSASFKQIETQTESYIRTICHQINEYFQEEVFYIRKMHIICKWSGSEIKLFVTDDAGKAEGYHPFPDYSEAEMCIIVNEAKSVSNDIFGALRRCTGFNYWIEVSSPGQTSGHFYTVVNEAHEWYPGMTITEDIGYVTRRVTAYQCPAIFTSEQIDLAAKELGENSPLFRSIYLAEFTSLDEAVVLGRELVMRACVRNVAHLRLAGQTSNKKCGVDLGYSKDETVAVVIDGNRIVDMLIMIENDTTRQVERLILFFQKHNLQGEDIAVDDSNFGHSVNDMLRLRGYSVRRVTNQSKPINNKIYANRGAEMWFNFKRMLELDLVSGLDNRKQEHKVLIDQLSSRYYVQSDSSAKIALESKQKARANNHGSPDRADALVLAFSFYNVMDLFESGKNVDETNRLSRIRGRTAAEFASYYEENVQYRGLLSMNNSPNNEEEKPLMCRPMSTVGLVRRRIGDSVGGIVKQFVSKR